MDRAAIVYNPYSRNAPSPERLLSAARPLKALGWDVGLRPTESPGHGTQLAREAVASGARAVFACGGDGTLNEVVNGLAGSDVPLGVIRGGMGNVFAKEIGIPRNPGRALRVLVEGETHRFDLGIAGERHFLVMCGIGFDAGIVRKVPGRAKRILGSTSYVLWGARELPRYHPQPVQLRLDGGEAQEESLYWLLLGNTRSYGGVADITNEALADDGYLDAFIFAGEGLPWAMGVAGRMALHRLEGAPGVSFQRLREVEVATAGLPVQIDGEYIGETPMHFAVSPLAISVMVPRGRGGKLLSRLPNVPSKSRVRS